MIIRCLETLLTISIILPFACGSILGQTLQYDAFLAGQRVGEFIIQKEVSDNKTSIMSKTHIEAHLLFSLTVNIETTSIYIDEVLVESETIQKQNGKIHSSVIIHQTDEGYVIDFDGDRKELKEEFLLGADLFYFEEPKQIQQSLELASGELLSIQKDEQGRYFFTHDGKKELHQYKNGKLDNVEINHQLYTIILKRRN